jgi:mannose-6-phosphate isomerase
MDPLVFVPFFRPQVWGARRLEHLLGKRLPPSGRFGESWEVSAHRLHVSRVADGPYRGQALDALWQQFGAEWYGPGLTPQRFPWLIKLLDCDQLLSVQVHPDDALAARLVPGESGKTEAWIVLHAADDARIYSGLLPGTTREQLQQHLAAGTVGDCLHSFQPQTGDFLFLNAGTVHSAGGGLLLAEIQQTSDATFRLFDWNRLDSEGRPRPLHAEQALESIAWNRPPAEPQRCPPSNAPREGVQCEPLVNCPYFRAERYQFAGRLPLVSEGRVSLWMVLAGQVELAGLGRTYRRVVRTGETVLVPPSAVGLAWTTLGGPATLLAVRTPTG